MIKTIGQIYNIVDKDNQIFITALINVIANNISKNTLYLALEINI